MRGIAEGRIFSETAAAELWVLHRAGDAAISIDKVNGASDAN